MNLLVIDDEKTILDTVYKQLMGMKLGMEQVDKALTTEHARELLKRFHYSIILCDIVMPKEDGITFAKWVLERYPQIKFIFLTAHADYSYMKEAISMQSFDYLLQPAKEEELQDVVERAKKQIHIEQKNSKLVETGSFYTDHEEELLDNAVLKYLTGQGESDIYLHRLFDACHTKLGKDNVVIPVYLQVLETDKALDTMDRGLLRSIYNNILDEIFRDEENNQVLLLVGNKGDCITLLCVHQQIEIGIIHKKLEELHGFMRKLLLTSTAIYCGNQVKIERLQEECQQLFETAKNNVKSESKVIMSHDYTKVGIYYSFELQLAPWNKLLEQKKYKEFQQSIREYTLKLADSNLVNAEYMIKLHQAITELILGHLVNENVSSEGIFDDGLPYLTYMESWHNLDTFQKAISYIMNKLLVLTNSIEIDVVEEAKKYINKNMDQDLSVSEIADYVGMNAEYFTKLFKKSYGCGLKKYIELTKMDAAKMLLSTTNLPVTLVASHVGYTNYSNFTRAFKQIVGLTPLEYRKNKNQKM